MDDQSEIFIVVDKNDKIVDYKPRSICHKKRLLHRTVAVAVLNDQGEVLLQKRSQTVDTKPGFYTLSATGHVSKGETYEQAAKKELKDFPHYEMQSFYLTHSNGPFKILTKDIEKVEFVPINKLPDFFSKSTATIKIFYNQITRNLS